MTDTHTDKLQELYLRERFLAFVEKNIEEGMTEEDARWTAEIQLAKWSMPQGFELGDDFEYDPMLEELGNA